MSRKLVVAVEELLGESLPSAARDQLARGLWPVYDATVRQVEALADFVQSRELDFAGVATFGGDASSTTADALAYCVARTQCGSGDEDAFDLRLCNPTTQLAALSLLVYLQRAREPVFSFKSYVFFSEFFAKTGSADDADKVMQALSPSSLRIVHRLVLLMRAVPVAEAAIAAALVRAPDSANKGADAEAALHSKRVQLCHALASREGGFFQTEYVRALVQRSQGVAFALEPLRELDWAVIVRGAELVEPADGKVIVAEGEPNASVYRIKSGAFSVLVGGQRVATLHCGDLFGELSVLGNRFTRATVQARGKGCALWRLDAAVLDVVFELRPELGSRFWLMVAQSTARRFSVMLQRNAVGAAPDGGATSAGALPVASAVAAKELRVDAVAALLAFKPGGSKAHKLNCLYLLTDSWVWNRVKWSRLKSCETTWSNTKRVVQGPGAAEVSFVYNAPNKKGAMEEAHFVMECADRAARDECFVAATRLLDSCQRQQGPPVGAQAMRSAFLSQGLAFFDYVPTSDSEVDLQAGDSIVVLDRSSESRGWVYGYCTRNAARRGLIPVSHIEFMPMGAELKGMPTSADWKLIFSHCEKRDHSTCAVVIKEGDSMSIGDLFLSTDDSLEAVAGSDGRKCGWIYANHLMGELSFLLGGAPRASIVVRETAQSSRVLVLRRKHVTQLIEADAGFACRFLKLIAVSASRRMMKVQPGAPPHIKAFLDQPAIKTQ